MFVTPNCIVFRHSLTSHAKSSLPLSPKASLPVIKKMDPPILLHPDHLSPVKRKVLGDLKNTEGSPISPTANLKLLTKVASQCKLIEYVNSSTGVLPANFYSIKVETETPPKIVRPDNSEVFDEFFNLIQHGKGIRKFKSLGFLCDKFLKLYPLDIGNNTYRRIILTDLANDLGVEKRRVYDIINVVESLQMATRIGKNSYTWTGDKKLIDMLSQLKGYAEQIGLTKYVRAQQLKRKLYIRLNTGEMEQTESSVFEENANIASFFRNERRIGILCQKFVMLFLVSLKDGLVNLELAANVLMSENCQQNKTRLRRLYDIANILVSLGIISKLDLAGVWKKPVFRYAGPSLDVLESLDIDGSLINKWVKTEYSDENSSDLSLSEDSHEPWRLLETQPLPPAVTHSDHSYSMAFSRLAEKRARAAEPPAKKRLLFSCESSGLKVPVLLSSTHASTESSQIERQVATSSVPERQVVADTEVKPTPTILRVMGKGSLPQPITNGGVYKALRVGNDIQLIRIDNM